MRLSARILLRWDWVIRLALTYLLVPIGKYSVRYRCLLRGRITSYTSICVRNYSLWSTIIYLSLFNRPCLLQGLRNLSSSTWKVMRCRCRWLSSFLDHDRLWLFKFYSHLGSYLIDLLSIFFELNFIAARNTSRSLFKSISLLLLNIVRRHHLSQGISTVSNRTHSHKPGFLFLIHVKSFFKRTRSFLTSSRSRSWAGCLQELLLHLSVSAVK